ncbi:Ubiquitin_carboxyl-terminal hydrolase family protein [Hexamita inflata]|uniref:Ubiquitin carboxyl-terminal hydrolase n=1 Tax=Hexamita inflata TaxID=28002 RepID=A0AA86PL85_9EUKA|nr:Ubiquitin carboxyl-terminal hydrolase family protein [Hexamita inflata]
MNYEEKQRQRWATTSIVQDQKVNFKGLKNNGATCYLNALLQSIFHTEVGYNFILNIQNDIKSLEEINHCEYISSDNNSVIQSLQLLFLRMKFSTQSELLTVKFCRSMNINTGIQEDANELMKTLQDKLEQVCKQQNMLGIYNQTFTGQSSIKYTCKHCGSESPIHTPFTDVMLPVAPNFFTCFAQMVSQYQISGYKCTQCNQLTYADQELSIQSVPDLLCFTLERFKNSMSKDCSQVHFPMCLDLEFINICNCDDLNNTDKDYIQRMIRVALMPWRHFRFEGQKIYANNAEAKQFEESPQFMQHLKQYYLCVNISNDELKTPIFSQNQTPPNFFTLKSIVRHSGSLTGGHYQSLIVQQALVCNDSWVYEHKISTEDLSASENYMYFYERAKSYESADLKFQRIKELIKEEDDREAELTRGRRLNDDNNVKQENLQENQLKDQNWNKQLMPENNQPAAKQHYSPQIQQSPGLIKQTDSQSEQFTKLKLENEKLKKENEKLKQSSIQIVSHSEGSTNQQQYIQDLFTTNEQLKNELNQFKKNQGPHAVDPFNTIQLNLIIEQKTKEILENAKNNLFDFKIQLQKEHETQIQELNAQILKQKWQIETMQKELENRNRKDEEMRSEQNKLKQQNIQFENSSPSIEIEPSD